MKVLGLYLKPRSGAEMISVNTATGIEGEGLSGDCHRNAASPRQVLVFSRRVLDQLDVQPVAVRANIVVDASVDDLPSGTVLLLGESLALRLTIPCEPCRKLEDHRRGLARDLGGQRGMLGRVISAGVTSIGDSVAVMKQACRPLHESWSDRVADIVRCLPEGMLLTYTQLAILGGLQTTYCRAFPRVLQRLRINSSILQAQRVISYKSLETQPGPYACWDGSTYYQFEEKQFASDMRWNPSSSATTGIGVLNQRDSSGYVVGD